MMSKNKTNWSIPFMKTPFSIMGHIQVRPNFFCHFLRNAFNQRILVSTFFCLIITHKIYNCHKIIQWKPPFCITRCAGPKIKGVAPGNTSVQIRRVFLSGIKISHAFSVSDQTFGCQNGITDGKIYLFTAL